MVALSKSTCSTKFHSLQKSTSHSTLILPNLIFTRKTFYIKKNCINCEKEKLFLTLYQAIYYFANDLLEALWAFQFVIIVIQQRIRKNNKIRATSSNKESFFMKYKNALVHVWSKKWCFLVERKHCNTKSAYFMSLNCCRCTKRYLKSIFPGTHLFY